ncbi:MAG: hypothetical protein AYK18_09780 [Theionarchaea archaeon DG-70]|nr:MAG: hypothetical protein AYK18_09780 [Theionarchaea archaeon DG-70]
MPLANAIITMTAFKEKAVLVSDEKHFKKTEEIGFQLLSHSEIQQDLKLRLFQNQTANTIVTFSS